MVRTNPEREKDIRRLWELGKTIDYTARVTGIPRSSVGYYVKKFNKDLGRRTVSSRERLLAGSGPSKNDPDGESQGGSLSALLKLFGGVGVLNRIQNLINSEDFERLYFFLASFELLPRVIKTIQPTDEEWAALLKDLTSQTGSGSAKQAPPKSPNAPPNDSKHLWELTDPPIKGPEPEKGSALNSTVRASEGKEKRTVVWEADAHIVEGLSSQDAEENQKKKKLNELFPPRLPQKDLASQGPDPKEENELSKALRAYEHKEKNKSVIHS